MADTDGQSTDSVAANMRKNPFEYDFFQLLRKLQAAHPDKPRIGESVRLQQDFVRLRQEVSLAFATSTIKRIEPDAQSSIVHVFNQFFGLWGPNGPMPHELTQYVLDQKRDHDDTAIADFADVFHHRLLSLFFKAWANSQKAVDYERPQQARFPRFFNSFFGAGMDGFCERDSIPDRAKTYYAGHLSSATPNQSGLRAILEDFFSIPARIEPFVGFWMELPADCRYRMGGSRSTGLLGQNLIVGERVWERQLKFRIVMGPMQRSDYERMLPGNRAFQMLKDWVRLYTRDVMFWDLQLILKAEEASQVQIGTSGCLGWNTWLMTNPLRQDSTDLILNPEIF